MTDLYIKHDDKDNDKKKIKETILLLQKYLAAEVAGRDLYMEQTKTLKDPTLVQALKSFAST
ncbi:MAG: hypothetical protein M0Z72_04240, partial [Deltaproteobacteria bacterium]|nr:hypothetical protein [Deltaproteobacteria bacterium]